MESLSTGQNDGRPKTYDADEIARKAMDLFWERGFYSTSTQDLVEHMQVNRYSLYAEFGSKQGLYEAALALYQREVVTRHFEALEGPDAGLKEIDALLAFPASGPNHPGSERGCLMCNSATERAPNDLKSREFVAGHLERVSSALAEALENAKRCGEIRNDVETTDEARFFAAAMLGFSVLLRARVQPEVISAAVRSARSHLKALC